MEYLGRIINDTDVITKKYFNAEADYKVQVAKNELNDKIDSVDARLNNKIDIETSERSYIDGTLSDRITKEVDTINSSIIKINADLLNEETARIEEDNKIKARLEEIRQEMLDLINAKIEQEIFDRKAEDARIERELGNRITQVETAISEERVQREFNDGILGSRIDSEVLTINTKLDKKQDKLVSGENIKTINGQSILGPGNIVIE